MKKLILLFIVVIIALSIAGRLLPHPPNFTPITALALFAGVYLASKTKWALLLPVAVMFFSDLVIGFYDIKLMAVVYGSFFTIGLIGMLVSKKKNTATIIFGTISASLLFFLVTNFAVWAFSPWYPHTIDGLLLSYTLALPFFRYALLGNFLFVGLFFGAYEFAPVLLLRTQSVFKPVLKHIWG